MLTLASANGSSALKSRVPAYITIASHVFRYVIISLGLIPMQTSAFATFFHLSAPIAYLICGKNLALESLDRGIARGLPCPRLEQPLIH